MPIQQIEFNVPVTAEAQPDLLDIDKYYHGTGGGFWGVVSNGELAGTIALISIAHATGAIRKMFVKKEYRGKEYGIAQGLLRELITYCGEKGITHLYLGTVDMLKAAHRFYERNGFLKIESEDLPDYFPRMKADNVFFYLLLVSKAQSKMDNIQHLDHKQQSIVNISALTAAGDMEQLKIQLSDGLDAGLTINEIKEIVVQLYAYCGFPRSLNGITAFMAVVEDRKAMGIKDTEGKTVSTVNDPDKYQTGKTTLQTLTKREENAPAGANVFAPAIDTFLKEHLFADIFSRDVLTFQQRELVTVSALAAMSGVASQLQAHILMGMNTGLTESQLSEAFLIIDERVSKSQGDIARATLEKVLAAKKQ